MVRTVLDSWYNNSGQLSNARVSLRPATKESPFDPPKPENRRWARTDIFLGVRLLLRNRPLIYPEGKDQMRRYRPLRQRGYPFARSLITLSYCLYGIQEAILLARIPSQIQGSGGLNPCSRPSLSGHESTVSAHGWGGGGG